MLVNPFKLSKRHIKSVEQDVISLGFPESSIKKWLNRFKYEYVNETTVKCQTGRILDVDKFLMWKDSVELNPQKSFSVHTAYIEKTPVYKVAYDFLLHVYQVSPNFSKNVQITLGERLKYLSYRLCLVIRDIYESVNQKQVLEEAMTICDELKFLIQVLKDLKHVSLSVFALMSERLVSVSKQIDAMHRKFIA